MKWSLPQRRMLFGAVLSAFGAVGTAKADEPVSSPGSVVEIQNADAESVDQVFNQQASFTRQMNECGASDGSCGAAAGCIGGADDGCWVSSLIGDEPLLSDLRGMQVGDGITAFVGGEIRYRFMNEANRLRPGGPGRSTYDLWRITPFAEFKVGDSVTAYVQAIDASIFNQELPITGIDRNRSDLLQYWVDLGLGDTGVHVRVGRQFLKYGSQHLVSPLGWSNTFRNFEGVKLYYKGEDWDIDGFWTKPVNAAAGNIFRPESFDHPDASRNFSGIYTTYKGMENATLDLYWLLLDEENDRGNRLDGERHTFGARYDRKMAFKDACGDVYGTLAFELEGAFQVGDQETFLGAADENIQAGMVHSVLGYTWNQAAWTPTLKGVFYWGSGDSNPGDGENKNFNPLFPLGHAHWGIIDNLNGSNLLDYSVQAIVKPADKLTFVTAVHWFDKAQDESPIFNVAGAPFPGGATTTNQKNIGTELDLIATWTATRTLQVQAGYSWFWYGDAVDTAAAPLPRKDASQFYLMTTWSF